MLQLLCARGAHVTRRNQATGGQNLGSNQGFNLQDGDWKGAKQIIPPLYNAASYNQCGGKKFVINPNPTNCRFRVANIAMQTLIVGLQSFYTGYTDYAYNLYRLFPLSPKYCVEHHTNPY
jgi:hypothetical protein